MGSGSVDGKRSNQGRDLAPLIGPQRIPVVLLPYEKQLAKTIGLTDEEFYAFKLELERNAKPRPAEYDHVPDIRCDPVSVLVSVAVGAILTGVSVLLAPKPKQQEREERRQIQQADLTGPTRYNSTYGFDSVGQIATWATTVPIPFGKYVNADGVVSGGLLINPDLVWSRLFSYGSKQVAKLLYAAGEWGAATPAPESTYVGTQPLSKLSEHNYAVYYRSGPGNNRIKASDLISGTRGTPASGDPEVEDEIFSCPTAEAEVDTGFSYSYTPTGDTAFGTYNIIPSGTIQRVNWKVVSRLDELSGKDGEARPKAEREKICGTDNKGMPGVGRSYGRMMGLYAYRAPGGDWVEATERIDVAVDIGWRVRFLISVLEFDYKYNPTEGGVTQQDLQSRSVNERARADDLLQLGETIQIGRMTWVIEKRHVPVWTEDGNEQIIELKCVERFGTPFITLASKLMIFDKDSRYLQRIAKPGENLNSKNHIGLAASPLAYQAMGLVRAVRKCDVIEVGIRSQVWQQFNGLCNFQEIPTESELEDFDADNVTITNGVMNLYTYRSSCFTIKVRKAGLDPTGKPYEWSPLNNQFVVRGNQPVDQYNFVRLYFPFREDKYEFRFEPLPGDVALRFDENEIFEQLDASTGTMQSIIASSSYGDFVIKYAGRRVAQATLVTNPETSGKAVGYDVSDTNTGATLVSIVDYDTEAYDTDHGKAHGWRSEVLGFPQLYPNQTRSRTIYKTIGSRSVAIEVTCTSVYSPGLQSRPGYQPELYGSYVWDKPRLRVVSSSPGWTVGDTFNKGYAITSDPVTKNNKFLAEAYAKGARTVIANMRVEAIGSSTVDPGYVKPTTRLFAVGSQLADVDYYPGLINKSNASSPEHTIVYVNEMVDNSTAPTYYNMNMYGLSVRASGRLTDVSQLRYWIPGGVQVYRTDPDSIVDGNGEKIGRSNLFSDLVWYLLTNKDTGVGDLISSAMLDEESFVQTSRFLARNHIFCDTVIQDAVNIREYATIMAPLMLCNFVMVEGRFAVKPAIPVDAAGGISLNPVEIKAIFTAGNIIEGSFDIEYLQTEERAPFKASATYRTGEARQLPEESNVFVRYAGEASADLEGTVPLESFPMAEWCTRKDQAVLACKYMLALRKHVTHTVKFLTSPEGLGLAPGDYIKVSTISNPFSSSRLGTITADGDIKSLSPIEDGSYEVTVYTPGSDAPQKATLTVKNGESTAPRNVVFSLNQATSTSGVYQVEQLTVNDDQLVEVVASSFPCDENGVSRINQDILQDDGNTIWAVSE
jgi:hypothetical protein